MRSDAAIIRELMEESQVEAVAAQARADYCWAIDDDAAAEDHAQTCATHQARARALSTYLATLEPTGALDTAQRPPQTDLRPIAASRPALVLHTNPGGPRG